MASAARRAGPPAYVYHFTMQSPVLPERRAHHAAEIPYVFGNLLDKRLGPEHRELSSHMIRYWSNFAKTINPNGQRQPEWPLFALSQRNALYLGGSIEARGLPRPEALSFWAAHERELWK